LTDEDKILLQELEAETDKKGSEVNFEDTEKLCRDFGVKNLREFHELKRKLRNRFKELIHKKLNGEYNPDFGISKRGFIVIRSTGTNIDKEKKPQKTVHTGDKP
jgi:hypothetical protein